MGIEIVSRNNDDSKSQKKKGKNNGRKKSQDNSEDEEKQKKKKKEIIIEDLRENHTYNRVCFEVTLLDEYAKKLKENDELFIKTFNLQSTINIKNMVLFSPEGKLKKYNSIEEILETFYNLRLKYYHLRKDYMISVLKKEVATLSNKARFIKMVLEDELIIKRKKRAVLVNELYDLKFDTQTMLNEKKQKTKEEKNRELELANSEEKGEGNSINQNEGNNSDEEQEKSNKDTIKPKVPIKEYDYLLNMNFWSLTQEKIEELLKQKELKEKELSILEQTEVETLWDNDLDNLEEELTKYEKAEEEDRLLAKKLNKNKSGAVPKRRGGGRKKKISEGKSEDNDNKSENSNSNNTSAISDSTDDITKKKKTKNKKQKTKKVKGQSSLNNFVNSTNKKKKQENKIENIEEENKSKSSDNEKDSSENDESENNPFNVPLKERLRKKIIDIGESPIPLDNLNYGDRVKREFSDDDSFSYLNLSAFDEKEKAVD